MHPLLVRLTLTLSVVDATVSDPPPTPAVTVQDDFSDLKPNDIRVIEAGIQEMSSKFVDLYPGGVTEEEEYPVEDQEKYDLRRARLVLLKKRTPAFPRRSCNKSSSYSRS